MEISYQFPWYSLFACYSSITYYLNLLYTKFLHLRYLSSTSGGSNSKGEDNTEPNSNEGALMNLRRREYSITDVRSSKYLNTFNIKFPVYELCTFNEVTFTLTRSLATGN